MDIAPTKIPVAIAESDDAMPIHESATEPSYIPNVQGIETNPSVPSSEKIDTIKPNINRSSSGKFGDNINGYPLIGWATFDSLLMTEMPDKEYMFMHGIKDGDWNTLQFTVDSTGRVRQFHPGLMPSDHIERVVKKTGKWYIDKKSAVINRRHKIFHQKRH